jgi:hypothetical protein
MRAAEIRICIRELMGAKLEMHVKRFSVTKERRLVHINRDGKDWIRAREILEVAQDSDNSVEARRYLNRRKVIETKDYLSLKDA